MHLFTCTNVYWVLKSEKYAFKWYQRQNHVKKTLEQKRIFCFTSFMLVILYRHSLLDFIMLFEMLYYSLNRQNSVELTWFHCICKFKIGQCFYVVLLLLCGFLVSFLSLSIKCNNFMTVCRQFCCTMLEPMCVCVCCPDEV